MVGRKLGSLSKPDLDAIAENFAAVWDSDVLHRRGVAVLAGGLTLSDDGRAEMVFSAVLAISAVNLLPV